MEEGPSSSSGFSTRATAPLQDPPVNLVHSIIPWTRKTQRTVGLPRCRMWRGCFSIPCEAHRKDENAINICEGGETNDFIRVSYTKTGGNAFSGHFFFTQRHFVEQEYLKRVFFTSRHLISDPKIILFTTFFGRSKAKIHFRTSLPLDFWGTKRSTITTFDGKGEFSHLFYHDIIILQRD